MDGATDFYRGRKVLVTGGTGMIGRQLVALLAERDADIRVASLDEPPPGPLPFEFRRGDLTDPGFCEAVVRDREFVFHLAGIKGSVGIGRTRAASFMVPLMLMNTLTMQAAHAAGVERFLYVSSIAVYPPAPLFVEDRAWDGPPHPSDRFAAWAKRIGELQAEAYREEFGWDRVAIVRPANVFGPGDNFDPATAMVVPALIARVLGGEDPLAVWGDGSQIRDFIYSRDCAEGMMLAIERGVGGPPVNLGSGHGTSIRELVGHVLACVDSPPRVTWEPDRPAGNDIRLMDTTRARELLGFRARTPLKEAIRETMTWYRNNPAAVDRRFRPFSTMPGGDRGGR